MDLELDLSSENMASFLELEHEIKEIPLYPEPMVRPSVIVKPSPKPSLGDIMTSCGIEYSLPEDCNVSSPSSIHSDVQLEQNNELISELEEFFRYREKKKGEQDLMEDELENLQDKNVQLKEKLLEMETEFKYLKKLMVEAGLGKYTLAVNY